MDEQTKAPCVSQNLIPFKAAAHNQCIVRLIKRFNNPDLETWPWFWDESLGAFLVRDNRVLNKPLGRSLRSFACTAHSTHSLCSTPLRYACFASLLLSWARSLTLLTPSIHGLTHSLCSLSHKTLGLWNHEYVFTLKKCLMEKNHVCSRQ